MKLKDAGLVALLLVFIIFTCSILTTAIFSPRLSLGLTLDCFGAQPLWGLGIVGPVYGSQPGYFSDGVLTGYHFYAIPRSDSQGSDYQRELAIYSTPNPWNCTGRPLGLIISYGDTRTYWDAGCSTRLECITHIVTSD